MTRTRKNVRRFIGPIIVIAYFTACGSGVERVKFAASPGDSTGENRRDRAQEKIDRIIENGGKSPVPPQTTVFTEDEVNQLLRTRMKEFIPTGLSDPHVRLMGNHTLIARLVVDLDEYKRRREGRGGLGPLAFLTGRVPVTARGTLQTHEGQGRLRLDASDVNGIPLPPALVREMITALSRSRRNPEGYDIEKPFALPDNIRNVTIGHQEAVVTQ
jgi:hypothetical protein